MRNDWRDVSLEDLESSGVIKLGRGDVISKKDMAAEPGPNPVYSSAENQNGMIGKYAKHMFDEELITWSVDGGGHIFYRPKHKFSVTNIGGWLRILDQKIFSYKFLTYALQGLHTQHNFDWQHKAHPSVIRKLYTKIPMPPLPEQERIVDLISSIDSYIDALRLQLESAKNYRDSFLMEIMKTVSGEWPSRPLGEIAISRLGKMLSKTNGTNTGEQSPYLRNSNVRWGSVELFDVKQMHFSEKEKMEFDLKKGDVLICEGGEPGRTVVLEHDLQDIFFQKALHRVRCGNSLLPKFLFYWMLYLSHSGTLKIEASSTTIAHLTGEKLRVIAVSLPPIEIQGQIVDVLSEIDSFASYISTTLQRGNSLRLAILSDLLNAKHEIPTSYDKVMGAA